MHTPTDKAIEIVRRMPLEERGAVRAFFDWHIPSVDSVWAKHPPWPVPAAEIDVALRLVEVRGY